MAIFSFIKDRFSHSNKQASSPTKNSTGITNKQIAIISASTALAGATVRAVQAMDAIDSWTYLCKSKATYADTTIFSCFVVRALCIMATSDTRNAMEFSDSYVSSVMDQAIDAFSLSFIFRDQFEKRADFYDRVFAKKSGIESKIAAILEEFEYIIKSDMIEGDFAPFSENSPLPILGMIEDMACATEIRQYFRFLMSSVDKELQEAIDAMKLP